MKLLVCLLTASSFVIAAALLYHGSGQSRVDAIRDEP